MSGGLVLVSLSKSTITPVISRPALLTGDEPEAMCRLTVDAVPVGAMSNGSAAMLFASLPVAVRQFARVVTTALLNTPVAPPVPLKKRSLKLLVRPAGFAAVPPTRMAT